MHDRGNAGFRALYDRAGLPASTYPAFREAIEAMREDGFAGEPGDAARLKRRMIERVLTRCEDQDLGEIEPLLTLLRRFAAEAAREEARLFCDELVADERRSRGLSCRSRLESQPSPGTSGGAKDVFQIIRPEAVFRFEEFVGDFAQPPGQRGGGVEQVGAGIFAHDRAHRIDVLVDQRQRNPLHVRRMLDQPAQAVGGTDDGGITERAGFALDVVGGAEQYVVGLLGEAVALDVLPRGVEPLALGIHPAGELARQLAPAPLRRAPPDRRRRRRPAPKPCAARAAA